jgi:hypothetical protein
MQSFRQLMSASSLRPARVLIVGVSLLTLAEVRALAQQSLGPVDYTDPEQCGLISRRQQLEVEQNNLDCERLALCEFESRASSITRQLEALSFMAANEVPSNMLVYAAQIKQELIRLQGYIEATRVVVAADAQVIEEKNARLIAQENEFRRRRTSQGQGTANTPMDESLDRANQQFEAARREISQRQKEMEAQNLLCMQQAERGPQRPGQGALPLPSSSGGDAGTVDDIKLCQLLERKVSEKDCDIAEINLLAAKGLPGSETLDVEKTLKILDLWAAWVRRETDRHLYRFQKAPAEFSNSEAYFRILIMVCTLQEDFKICYHRDPKMRAGPVEVVPDDFTFFGNPKDLFIHGLTEGEHQGTCASLPVLYVAVGRRLGYPLKLVECKGHLFVRWEDARERFNIEGTNRGVNCYPDEEYVEWPWPISQDELATGMYMKSLSPRRELAAFLELRALCLKQHGREKQHRAVKVYADGLRRKEGVDLARLATLMKDSVQQHSSDGTVESALLFQTLTNTNSWRSPKNRRGSHEVHSVFSAERANPRQLRCSGSRLLPPGPGEMGEPGPDDRRGRAESVRVCGKRGCR